VHCTFILILACVLHSLAAIVDNWIILSSSVLFCFLSFLENPEDQHLLQNCVKLNLNLISEDSKYAQSKLNLNSLVRSAVIN
jgi:hypothetical protein